ncbi:efflux RND transporter periplasmic adaptor subunit [Methyloglobulus sp.]|uniref:efflux RND transporter periplasmic adaptor subunit n=1 Tax=Methyloglobulus sp. TaxID=2518622 RepID=UPI0032B7D871
MKKSHVVTMLFVALIQAIPVFAEGIELVPEALDKQGEISKIEDQLPEQNGEHTGANTEQLLRAQIKARESTQISSEMSGRITQLKVRDGERFSAGQVLVGFHCSLEEAQLSKAKATLEKKRKTHEVNQKLEKLNSISTLQLAVSKTEEDEAKADVRVTQTMLERCTIKAPFSGKVVEVTARAYQSVREGEPLLEIINEKDLEVEFIAPSRTLPQLKPGKTFKVTLDETTKTYKASIIRLGGRVDPVSQTIKVYGRITDNSAELLPGMSGAIQLTHPSE